MLLKLFSVGLKTFVYNGIDRINCLFVDLAARLGGLRAWLCEGCQSKI